ncbi:MAG: hypothetical protein KJO69_07730 [Gammaproteobacteria bacterium]|nr:hypothetical protein [Gammaproteobacteria bacterium]
MDNAQYISDAITKVRESKKRAESKMSTAITEAVMSFEMETGLSVTGVDVELINTTTLQDVARGRADYQIGEINIKIHNYMS